MGHVISASRRTDIPAFYADWLLNRLRAGRVRVANPYNPAQVRELSLRPGDVDALVLWTKHPAALLGRLDEMESLGHRFYFQYTLNDYPRELEPGMPPLDERVAVFEELAGRIGPERVVWRYDPIIVSDRSDFGYHRAAFAALCARLGRHTRRVMVSVVDWYRKTRRNLQPLERRGYRFDYQAVQRPQMDGLLGQMASEAADHGLQIRTCAEPRAFDAPGLEPGACVDGVLIEALWGVRRAWKQDAGQRSRCRCAESRDIGAFDPCLHACPYCYANRDPAAARARHARHDPGADMLVPPA